MNLRKLLRRRFDFRLDPCASLEPVDQDGSAWRARDAAAWFDVVPVEGRFPSGWVLIECRLVRRSSDFTAALYLDTGAGFDAASPLKPPVTRKGVLLEMVRLPPGIRAMRWQAMRSPGVFRQSPLVMTEIRWAERVARMWRRIVPMFFVHSRAKLERLGLTPWRALFRPREAYQASGSLRAYAPAMPYAHWIERFDTLSDRDRELIRSHVGRLRTRPLISVLMVVSEASQDMLREAIESVLGQLYPSWELCIAGDESTEPGVLRLVERYAAADSRIKLTRPVSQAGVSAASNAALALAAGDFFALVEHDGVLAEHALYMVAVEIDEHRELSMVYTDEDRLSARGQRSDACHKPDWNPALSLAQNLVGHLGVFRTSLVRELGGFRAGFDGGQDYDLALRVAERAADGAIRHVPMVLYHSQARQGADERACGQSPGAWDAGRRVIEEHLARLGVEAGVGQVPRTPYYKVRYPVPAPGPLVSIVIPTRDRCDLLRGCLDSIFDRTRYGNFEIIVVDNASSDPATLDYLEQLSHRDGVTLVKYGQAFNYAAINNLGVRQARGTVLCLLNNDTEVIAPEWLEEMLGHLLQPGVAVVGAKLLYPEDLVQHAGVLLNVTGVAGHAHAFYLRDDPGYFGRAVVAQDFMAVTGACMMVRREVYEALGGLDEANLPVVFNDVDFCLRAREAGHRVVWTPGALLYHHESLSRGADDTPEKRKRFAREKAYMRSRWGRIVADPFYNPNLSHERPDFSLSNAPLVRRPWLE